jgi:ABC-type transport system substrate-binding protein
MIVKRLLLFIPLVVVFLLLQSYFWVPTYENQASGNPGRLVTYIEASSGDAKFLNPILSADSSSSSIVSQVFEGLLDLDENLNLRGRLATDWQISERAYLLVNPYHRFSDGTEVTGTTLFHRLQTAWLTGTDESFKKYVQSLELLPATERKETISLLLPTAEGRPQVKEVPVTVTVPERIAFTLSQVDQDLFDRLNPILGEQYFDHFPFDEMIQFPKGISQETEQALREKFPTILPVGEHNPTIVFHLRKNVNFHDGHEFDAGDVKFTYEAIMDPKNLSPRTPDFEPIKTVEILDPYTVKIIYKRLYSPAINAWTMGILPEHLLNDTALDREKQKQNLSQEAKEVFGMRDSPLTRQPIGSGRFQFVAWKGDQFIHLKRFDDYWEGPAQYQDYYMRIIPELFTQEVEFRTGAIDFYGALPHQVDRYKKDPTYQWFSSLGFAYNYIGYNNRKPLFAEADIRRALGMAINIEEIIQYLVYGEGERITGPYPKNTEWYDPAIQPLPYDPQGAQDIFQKHGWQVNEDGWLEKNGEIFEFNLITNNGNPIRKNLLTIAQNAWKKIGVKVNTQIFEWAVFLGDFVNTGDFDAVVLGWSMGIDPDLYQIWHSSQSGPQQLNFVGFKSQRADQLIVRIRQEYNRDQQRKLTHELHRLIHEDQPYTFLYAPLSTRVLDKKIVLVNATPDGKETYQKIYPLKSGDIYFHFHKWRKLESTPVFNQ